MRGRCLKLALAFGVVLVAAVTTLCADDYRFTSSLIQTIPVSGPIRLQVENPIGNLSIEVGTEESVSLFAVKKADDEETLAQISVSIDQGEDAVVVRAQKPQRTSPRWAVDFVLRVPAGTELELNGGVGNVALRDYVGCASVQVGTGSLSVESFSGMTFSANVGVGDAVLAGLSCDWAHIEVGVGKLDLRLTSDASYTVSAEVGMGGLAIEGFPGMQLEVSGFLGKQARGVLGSGAGNLQLKVGVGDLFVRPTGG